MFIDSSSVSSQNFGNFSPGICLQSVHYLESECQAVLDIPLMRYKTAGYDIQKHKEHNEIREWVVLSNF